MIRSRNFLPLAAAALVGVAMLAQASPARAGLTLTLKTTGQADQTFNLTSGTINTQSATIGAYGVTVTASDSAPGISPFFGGALLSQNTFTVSSAGALGALEILVQDDTFSSTPYASVSPLTVNNSLSTTLITNGTVTANGYMNTLTTADISLVGPTMSGSVANSASGNFSLGSTFTLGNYARVAFTNNGSGQANFTVTTLAPVPEPTSMVAALTGLPLGIGAWKRRRRRMA